jgi:hypothetical protein
MTTVTTKFCCRCKQPKALTEFGVHNANWDGLHSMCRSCCADYRRERKAKDPGAGARYARASRERDRERYNAQQREWYHRHPEARRALAASIKERNRAYVRAIKLAGACVDCGLTVGPDETHLLEFDHLPGTTKHHNVAKLVQGYSIATIQAEIDKCELVCQRCHRTRTFLRG